MARKRGGEMELLDDEGEPVEVTTATMVAPAPVREVPPVPLGLVELPPGVGPCWRVSLLCPTPLAHPTLVLRAKEGEAALDTDEKAREAFCRANNISGSAHEWKVERVG